MKRNAVCFICDNNYKYNVLLYNVIKQYYNYNNYDAYILYNNHLKYIDMFDDYNVQFIDVEPYIHHNIKYYSPVPCIYNKIYIPLIKELKQYDKVLYLDNDIQIYKNLDNIFNLDFFNHEIIGFREEEDEYIYTHYKYIKNLKYNLESKYNITSNILDTYINAGVLLYNMMKFNSYSYINIYNRIYSLTNFCDIVDEPKYTDQTYINLCYDILSSRDYKYNCNYYLNKRKNIQDIHILHYIGNSKKYLMDKINT